MRQRRPRSTHLSEDVLAAARGYSNQLNKQVTEMINTLTEQMTSPVAVDLREPLSTQMNLANRACKWIRGKSIDGTFVTISQLASFLKVKKAMVPGIVKTLLGSIHGNDETVIQLYIFVEKNQVPQWLREMLRHIDVCRLLSRARMVDNVSMIYRQEFKRQLSELPDFRENLIKVWAHGRNSVVRALYTVGIIETANFDINVDMDWMAYPQRGLIGLGGNVCPGVVYDNGTNWTLDYGSVTYERVDKLNFDPHHSATLEYRESKRHVRNKPTEAEVAERLQQAQAFVNWMAVMNYQLYHCGMSFSSENDHRPILSFAGKSGMGEKVTVRLPWVNTIFRIKA